MSVDHQSLFGWGCYGSLLVDVIAFGLPARRGRILARYKRWDTYVGIGLLAVAAGLLAVALSAPTPYGAIYVGASLPTIIRSRLRRSPAEHPDSPEE